MASSQEKRTTIRLDPGIRERIIRWRWTHHRPSLTVAVNMLLDQALSAEGYPAADSTQTDTHR